MDELGLFTAALGLSAPWRVTRTEFDGVQLELYLDFPRGSRFACPARDCAEGACVVHDTADRTWRHRAWALGSNGLADTPFILAGFDLL
jgi:transposase